MPLGHIFKVSASIGVIRVKQIVISTYSYRQQVVEYITNRLEQLKAKEYSPLVSVEERSGTTFVTCALPQQTPKAKVQRYFETNIITPVANAMVDIIQAEFAVDYANEVLQANYGFEELVISAMIEDKRQTKELLDPIIEEIMTNHQFCLDGWIRFRLAPYKVYMIDRVEKLAAEYTTYKEYEDFIDLIQSYILDQPPLMEEIHMMPSRGGAIELYDDQKKHMVLDMTQYECQDDLILGTLLTIAPSKITIHKERRVGNSRLIETIKSIYADRVSFCKGCQYCSKLKFKATFTKVLKEILTHKKV